jgi:hypothetical protein
MLRTPKPPSPVPTVSTMDLMRENEYKVESPKSPRPGPQGEHSYSPSGSPTLAINPVSNSSIPRSMALRPKIQLPQELVSGEVSPQYGTSPSLYGASPSRYGTSPPQYGTSPSQYGTSPSQYGTSPRYGSSAQPIPRNAGDEHGPRTSGLAPDSFGREIPLDALWTKIKRSVISTEVLEQDRRRYEA